MNNPTFTRKLDSRWPYESDSNRAPDATHYNVTVYSVTVRLHAYASGILVPTVAIEDTPEMMRRLGQELMAAAEAAMEEREKLNATG